MNNQEKTRATKKNQERPRKTKKHLEKPPRTYHLQPTQWAQELSVSLTKQSWTPVSAAHFTRFSASFGQVCHQIEGSAKLPQISISNVRPGCFTQGRTARGKVGELQDIIILKSCEYVSRLSPWNLHNFINNYQVSACQHKASIRMCCCVVKCHLNKQGGLGMSLFSQVELVNKVNKGP